MSTHISTPNSVVPIGAFSESYHKFLHFLGKVSIRYTAAGDEISSLGGLIIRY
jgi:hypothetical protein